MSRNLIYQYYIKYTGSDTHIITENDRGFPSWAEIGIASAKSYASRVGVEYKLSTKATMDAPNQNLESCRIFLDPWFDQFDTVLLLDIDTLVPTNENIFDLKVADIGMIQDGGPGSPKKFIQNIVKKIEKYGNIEFSKSTTFPNEKRYCNGGVQVWSKAGRLKARKLFGGMPEIYRYREATKLNEQPYINLMLHKHNFDVTELPTQWNRMNYMWKNKKPDGKINHFLATNKSRMKDYI